MRAIRYAFDEALESLWRGRQAGLLSTATIALALLVLGALLLVTTNLRRLGAGWNDAAELSVYFQGEITPAEQADVEGMLQEGDIVAGREYVSKDVALKRFKETFGDLAAAIDTAGDNPLPASYEVRLQPAARARGVVEGLAARLRMMAGVADVRYDGEWLDRLLAAISVIRAAGFVLGAILTVAAALTVANVVRLALHARREELEIMQLVGAPRVYIRGPFVMEGILQGGLGALLALVLLGAGFFAVRARYIAPLASSVDIASVRFLPLGLCVLLVVGGMVVGCVGGLVAARSR